MAPRQTDELGVRNILAGGYHGQRSRTGIVPYEPMPPRPHDRIEYRDRILEPRSKGWTEADSEKAHLADRAGRKRLCAAEPSARSHMVGMRLPSTRDQK